MRWFLFILPTIWLLAGVIASEGLHGHGSDPHATPIHAEAGHDCAAPGCEQGAAQGQAHTHCGAMGAHCIPAIADRVLALSAPAMPAFRHATVAGAAATGRPTDAELPPPRG